MNIIKSTRKPSNAAWLNAKTSLLIAMTVLAAGNLFGQLNLSDGPQGLPNVDNRTGSVAPTSAQLSSVATLGAKAEWNQFGTVHTLIKYGGYLGASLSGDPVSAARDWIRAKIRPSNP